MAGTLAGGGGPQAGSPGCTVPIHGLPRDHAQCQLILRRAVFFDRDGTLMEEVHYCSDPALVRVFPGVPDALRRLKAAGFRVFVITNQSGIGRGLITEAQYHAVQEEFLRQAGREWIDATYYCPDAPGVPSHVPQARAGHGARGCRGRTTSTSPTSYFVGDKSRRHRMRPPGGDAYRSGADRIRSRTALHRRPHLQGCGGSGGMLIGYDAVFAGMTHPARK